jgi:hypothetical protein
MASCGMLAHVSDKACQGPQLWAAQHSPKLWPSQKETYGRVSLGIPGYPLWKERLALGVFLTAPLCDAPYFQFDVQGNLLDGLYGKYSNYSISFIQVITLTIL